MLRASHASDACVPGVPWCPRMRSNCARPCHPRATNGTPVRFAASLVGSEEDRFLSFGHWSPHPQSGTRSASDALLQSIDLAVAAEEVGIDGAYFRVHHFARQLASPFPLLAAVAARTSRIEIGTGVIDMRYENPLYMAEEAGATDLISGGRIHLGISRGSPEQVIDGYKYFGYDPPDGDHAEMPASMRPCSSGDHRKGFASPNPRPMFPNPPGPLPLEPQSPGLRERIWWGAGTRATAEWAAARGMNLMSSTLLTEDAGVPFHELQREQIALFHAAWAEAGHDWTPRHVREPQHLPDRRRHRPSALRLADEVHRHHRLPRRRQRDLRQDLRRRARPARRGAPQGHRDRRGRHAPCSRSPTSSASTTTPSCWRTS